MPAKSQESNSESNTKRRVSLPGGFRLLSVVFAIAILIMLAVWRPWQANVKASDRTISVTGEATLRATPDEYVFSPSYDFTETDSSAALAAMTAKSDEIVTKLKALGVADKAIQTDSNGSSDGLYLPVELDNGSTTYTLSLTITLDSKNLVQKVQDYLVSTSPTGDVTPTASFSTAKQKLLQNQARDQAEKDARAKADQTAQNLGFKVAAVKSVQDGSLDGGPIPMPLAAGVSSGAANGSTTPSLAVQPGQNDLSYSVDVVYYIR